MFEPVDDVLMFKKNAHTVTRFRSSSSIHTGLVRKKNEDACLEATDSRLWAVADGIGGQPKGDFASQAVVEALAKTNAKDDLADYSVEVESLLTEANHRLLREARKLGRGPIGTTVAVLLLNDERFVCLWAGDSRIYRLRNGQLSQLTIDHSAENVLGQAVDSSQRVALARAVGLDDAFTVDAQVGSVREGDLFLLCTDGLTKEVDESHIVNIMVKSKKVNRLSNQLVNAALQNGGRDNIAVVVVESC